MRGSVLVVISDTHIGSTTGLATPTYNIQTRNPHETQEVQANVLQRWLWECWTDFWAYVREKQGKGKNAKRLIVVHLGDVIDNVHHSSTQAIPEVGDQMTLAYQILEPIAHRANTFFGILGTPAHAGIDHSHEAKLYRELGAQDYGQQLTLDIDGIIHDFAHHGRAGGRPWTSASAGIVTETIVDYATRGQRPPNFVWRGHRHVLDDSGHKIPGTRAISCPSWQLKTSYAHRVSTSVRSDIGGMIVVDGILDASKARYKGQADERTVIKV